jgi:tectonin-like protein
MKSQVSELKPAPFNHESNSALAKDPRLNGQFFENSFRGIQLLQPQVTRPVLGCFVSLIFSILAVPTFGHCETKSLESAHLNPGAVRKTYAPAAVLAMAGLQCQLYPEGGTPSKGLTVYSDDDGYARFHAVHATSKDPVQRLYLDCSDSAGKSYSYPVDLTSEETFAPRPLILANEPGIVRPALQGDPLSYTQSELIQSGYGLRPDPADSAAYTRWLTAASVEGMMLYAKRQHLAPEAKQRSTRSPSLATPKSEESEKLTSGVPQNTVVQTTDPWWVGSTLNGAPSYVASETTFNVPKGIPDGDETNAGTEIAIWTGVEGPTTALIQTGVGIQTNLFAATYDTWREYCCGNPNSNGYGGAFTPNPGDVIYAAAWYCDSQGNLNLKAARGCTFLEDMTTGAILNCTAASGSPCWSVAPVAGWVGGNDADFVIEGQSPQCCGESATAFTDFAPEVTMSGSAYSSKTDTFSQTVTSDPLVYVLNDFTNTTSHVNVTLGSTDETYFNSSQFKEVSGLANNSSAAEAIAVGPNANGSPVGVAWTLGYDADENGNYAIYQWQPASSTWTVKPGRATHIAVSPQGFPWVVNKAGQIFYWSGNSFELAPGNACASWIGVGANAFGSTYGDPWILGCHEQANGYNIYQLQGSNWVQFPGQAVKLAVGPLGPWIISKGGSVSFLLGNSLVPAPGSPCATDIAVAQIVYPFGDAFGDAWITGCNFQSTGYNIYQLQWGTWVQVPGQASQISVSPDLGVPWIVDSNGHIYK